MADTTVVAELNGEDRTRQLLEAGALFEVEESMDEPDAASISVGIEATEDGEWTTIIDDLAAPDAELVVRVERASGVYTFSGLVVGATWTIDAEGESQLVVRALDRTVAMDREERVVPWPGTADSVIASTIFSNYGFGAEVETTPDGPSPDVYTPMQRGTDWAFLQSLAAKWGYATFLEADGDKIIGHFRSLDPRAEPSQTLRLGFGADSFAAEVQVDFDGGGTLQAARIPPLGSGPVTAEADGLDQLQGTVPIAVAAIGLLGPADVDGDIDPFAAATGMARRDLFGVRLTTSVDLIAGGPLVRARRTVDVAGLGSRLSGLYLVQRVRHRLSEDHHEQEIELTTNSLGAAGGPGGVL